MPGASWNDACSLFQRTLIYLKEPSRWRKVKPLAENRRCNMEALAQCLASPPAPASPDEHAQLARNLAASASNARPFTTWGEATSISAEALARCLAFMEAYDPFADAAEVAEHEALCAAHGWSKSRFGIYGVTPCRTISRVLEACARRGAAPTGSDCVVLGSSVGWVALGLAFLLPNIRTTVGLEILERRVDVAREARDEANSPATWDLDVRFYHGDARAGERAFQGAALIWDSLGFGGGARGEVLAVVAKHAPPGCIVVTYDDLPAGFDLGRLRPLGEPLVLPNSWTPKQRYYVFEVVADGEARADVAQEGFEHPLALTDDAPLRALADSHQGRRHPDALTADGALPEADQRPFLDQLAATLGTDAVAGFLAPAPTAAPAAAPSAPAPPLPPSADA